MTKLGHTSRQQSKATLRRLLHEKSVSVVKETPDRADWLVNEMTAVAVVPPQDTYKDFADTILSYCKPKDVACGKSLTIIYFILPTIPQSNNQLISQKRSAKP